MKPIETKLIETKSKIKTKWNYTKLKINYDYRKVKINSLKYNIEPYI